VKKFLLLTILQLLCLPLMAAEFVVTSNADAGAGSLREALNLATNNGSTVKDYISFNLADQSEVGRTIALMSSLPQISSNIVIDGSTQPSQKIGISDARIIITLGNITPPENFKCFWATNKTDIEIDGFYFSGIASAGGTATAVSFNNVKNITIGSSARGNVFGLVDTPVNLMLCSNITLSANWFGINPKTSLPAITAFSTNMLISSANVIKIGGDKYTDGNVFVKSAAGHESLITDVNNCDFKRNTFGYKTADGGSGNSLKFNNIGTLNLVSNIYNYGSVNHLSNITVLANIKSNRTNLDSKQIADAASTSVTPFELESVKKTIFGGVNPREGNVINNPTFAGDYPSLITKNCGDVLLQRNSMSCKSTGNAYVSTTSVGLPVISITSVNNNVLSGKATPNAIIEVYSDSQCQLCEPNTYLGSVTATASGNWTFTATIPASGYTASASTSTRTSLFAKVGYDAAGVVIAQPTCGHQDGSIKGMKVLNSTKTEWTDQAGHVISNSLNIENMGPGTYTFKAYLGPYCATKSVSYTLNGVMMDESQKIIKIADCVSGKGSVTNIKVTGATTYQWFNSSNTGIATTPDLIDVPPGDYHLVASNGTCRVTSQVYTILQQINTINYGGLTKNLKDATCGLNSGSIEVVFSDNPPALPKLYRWINHSTGLTVAKTETPRLTGIDAGTYDLYVTDNNSCEKFLIAYSITRIPGLTVTTDKVQVNNDNCGTSQGSVKGLGISGKAPVTVTWTDAAGKPINNTVDLLNVPAGTYHVKVTDGAGCEQGMVYTVGNQTTFIPAPVVADVQICSPGETALTVLQPLGQYSYRLYETGGSLKPLDEQKSGRFKVNVKANRSFYITQFMGTCESSRAEVKVSLEITSADIGNAFSPNGDGINDYWKVTGIENYPKADVQIYTRDGQKIYQSIGYAIPFNGTYNGRQLPIGTYYYIINLHAGCSLLSGSLTVIR
jgi:gliding motility-associated-like protein